MEEEDDKDEDKNTVNLDRMEKQMKQYLENILAERDIQDLKETREQILGAFECITCFASWICSDKEKVHGQRFRNGTSLFGIT